MNTKEQKAMKVKHLFVGVRVEREEFFKLKMIDNIRRRQFPLLDEMKTNAMEMFQCMFVCPGKQPRSFAPFFLISS